MHVLDRVFHRDDVTRTLVVDAVDDAGQRRRLARTRRTGDQHQTLLQLAEAQHVLGDLEVLGFGQPERNHADDRRERTALAEDVRAESPDAVDGKREVIVVVLFLDQRLDIPVGKLVQGLDDLFRLFWT